MAYSNFYSAPIPTLKTLPTNLQCLKDGGFTIERWIATCTYICRFVASRRRIGTTSNELTEAIDTVAVHLDYQPQKVAKGSTLIFVPFCVFYG